MNDPIRNLKYEVLKIKTTDGDVFQIVNISSREIVRTIEPDKFQSAMQWLDDFKAEDPDMIGIVDFLSECSNLDIDEARAVASYWEDLRGQK